MSVAEQLTVEIPHHRARPPHAAVAALVGGPYPNLVTTPRPRPRLVTDADRVVADTSAAPVGPAPDERAGDVLDLRRTGDVGFPAGGPYPNLSTARR